MLTMPTFQRFLSKNGFYGRPPIFFASETLTITFKVKNVIKIPYIIYTFSINIYAIGTRIHHLRKSRKI
jgi:hypothetical protein